ncbi:hypothetical protein PHISCL_00254 [Aspergillus sclerotialis]|uniref:R3H-associated N-terminal domain-containing protein n=1 Tax=Aspergillus sclerotialis TaxID=2070753 RepID=A0A3A2ZW57_9EURO|nr:hypothetical protein PHISCL_00254 [Aspergillus sclerotialis]
MAIHPELRSQGAQGHLSPQQSRAISAWTEQAAASLQGMTISDTRDEPVSIVDSATARTGLRGASVSLAIPLDDDIPVTESQSTSRVKFVGRSGQPQQTQSVTFRRREPIRRDSLRRREALLKGKDGSRRRQRWENDRLLNNPWAEPPSPNDWTIQPTYPRHDPMPYYLAPLWDVHYAHIDRKSSKQSKDGAKDAKHRIPKDLRLKLKHARAARGMLQDLEEEVRQFIQKWNTKQLLLQKEGLADAPLYDEDSEDEVVFVGRNGQMHDSPTRKERFREMRESMNNPSERDGEKMVFESSIDDRAAGFGRWLVYSIASYYGLHTWSVTVGEPARREAYVGFYPPGDGKNSYGTDPTSCRQEVSIKPDEELPKPLWAQV